jgi:hypothetical protein
MTNIRGTPWPPAGWVWPVAGTSQKSESGRKVRLGISPQLPRLLCQGVSLALFLYHHNSPAASSSAPPLMEPQPHLALFGSVRSRVVMVLHCCALLST